LLVADGGIEAAFLQDGLADIMRSRVRRRPSRSLLKLADPD
jgi:hypothetical protein